MLNWSSPDYWISLVYSIPAILIALSFHEFAHAWVANKLGDPTARLQGRMTIDPTKHLDPLGTIAMVFCRFGWARPVPIDVRNFKKPKRDEILVSIAGVIMNLLLSFIAYGILFAVVFNIGSNAAFLNIMWPIVTLNVYLAVFNIIPVPPLDGFHIISSLFMKRSGKAVVVLYRFGSVILLILVFSGIVSMLLQYITTPILMLYESFFMLFVG